MLLQEGWGEGEAILSLCSLAANILALFFLGCLRACWVPEMASRAVMKMHVRTSNLRRVLYGEPERTRDQREHNEPGLQSFAALWTPLLCRCRGQASQWSATSQWPSALRVLQRTHSWETQDSPDPDVAPRTRRSLRNQSGRVYPSRPHLPQTSVPPSLTTALTGFPRPVWVSPPFLSFFFFLIQVFSLTNSLHIKSHLGCFASQATWANRASQQCWNPKPCRLPHSSLSAAITVTNACQGGRRKRVGTGLRGQTACCSFGLWEVTDPDLVTFHLFRPTFHLHPWAFLILTSWSLDKFLLNTHSATRPGLSNRSIMWTTSVI